MDSLPAPKANHKPRVTAGPYGDTMYVVIYEPGTILAAFPTRHHAVGWMATLSQGPHRYGMSEQRYSIITTPLGEIPMDEMRVNQ